jgi:YheC/D like ATP-grasp
VTDTRQLVRKIRKLTGSAPYIIQTEVPFQPMGDRIFDIRLLVQKNRMGEWMVTNAVSRIAYQGCFNTSVAEKVVLSEELLLQLYDAKQVQKMMGLIREISLQAAESMESCGKFHLGEISVDFALDHGGQIWIIEVNGKPQKDLYAGIRKQYRVYKRPIEYARFLCKQ